MLSAQGLLDELLALSEFPNRFFEEPSLFKISALSVDSHDLQVELAIVLLIDRLHFCSVELAFLFG